VAGGGELAKLTQLREEAGELAAADERRFRALARATERELLQARGWRGPPAWGLLAAVQHSAPAPACTVGGMSLSSRGGLQYSPRAGRTRGPPVACASASGLGRSLACPHPHSARTRLSSGRPAARGARAQAADVVCATCAGAGDPRLAHFRFRKARCPRAAP